jgi:hypothetical protein
VSKLVDEHGIEDPRGNRSQPFGYADLTGVGVARAPPFALVTNPVDRARPDTVEVAVCQLLGTFLEAFVIRMVHRSLAQQTLDKLVDDSVAFR